MTDINTNISHAVYVLGDSDTCERTDMLAAAAAERGADIRGSFAFADGEALGSRDLSDVDAVVEALGWAIATKTDVWLPFWLQDFAGEQHLRALSITLRRHGLDLLLGRNLAPCPAEGGINRLDAAVRAEINAVFALEDAALAVAGIGPLSREIDIALAEAAAADDAGRRRPSAAGEKGERYLSTAQTAALLGKSATWVTRGLRAENFVYADGTAVIPMRRPDVNGHVFTVPMVQAIALSAFRRGTLGPQRLEAALAELAGGAR